MDKETNMVCLPPLKKGALFGNATLLKKEHGKCQSRVTPKGPMVAVTLAALKPT